MTIRFAVLGCGRTGKMHAEMLERNVSGTSVSVVCDVVDAAAQAVSDDVGARVAASLADAVSAALQSMQENRPVTIAEVDRASETKAES